MNFDMDDFLEYLYVTGQLDNDTNTQEEDKEDINTEENQKKLSNKKPRFY